MSTERATPLAAVRRHKKMAALLALIGVVAGLGLALTRPTHYTAEARLAVGGNAGLAAEAVPGFALAAQQLAANYARYVNNAQEQTALEFPLGVRAGTVEQVSASPIPQSNVVRVEAVARTSAAARAAVAATSESLMEQVNDTTSASSAADATLDQYTEISNQVAAAQQASDAAQAALGQAQGAGSADVQQLGQAAADAAAQLAILQVQQQALGQKYRNQISEMSQGAANLMLVQEPAVTGDDRVAQLGRFGVAGLAAGLLAALVTSVLRERRRTARTAVAADDLPTPPVDADELRPAERRLSGSAAGAGERAR
ncbi:hypothetical protein ACI78V_08385 [Geodermatophilus sp. SYSU D00742]